MNRQTNCAKCGITAGIAQLIPQSLQLQTWVNCWYSTINSTKSPASDVGNVSGADRKVH